MIFSLNYINHDIERINDVPITFFQGCITAGAFSNGLFPDWFLPVVNASPVLRGKFEAVFNKLNLITVAERQALFDRFTIELQISELCGNGAIIPMNTLVDYPGIHEEFKDLFTHLFNDTLQKSTTLNQALNTDLKDHYRKWKEANAFIVCPFCGLENYTTSEGTNRDPYDHWLSKSKYPLSSVNFYNLVPIGDKCNQTAVKGEVDVLHANENRRLSFYPYLSNNGIRINLICITPPKVGFKGVWDIEIEAIDVNEQVKVQTWISVFNLKTRYLSWIKDFLESWKEAFMKYVAKGNLILTPVINDLKNVLLNWKNTLLPVEIFSGVLLLEAFINYLLNAADDAFVYAFCSVQVPLK